MKNFDLSLYLVLDPGLCRNHSTVETARLAVAGGATMVQLRDKEASTGDLIATGLVLQEALAGSGVPLIINDNVEAAIAIGAAGIHVGQGDMPAADVRRRVGLDMILGLSAENEAAVRAADPAVVDYLGLGPVFATPTKPGHKPPIGFEGLARLVRLSPVPTVAIGGLKTAHVHSLFSTGVDGMAVVSAICGQATPDTATQKLAAMIQNEQQRRGTRHAEVEQR